MEANYVVLLDYSFGEIIKIRLTEAQKAESEEYNDFEEFLLTLEDEYGFRLSDCCWMAAESLSEKSFL